MRCSRCGKNEASVFLKSIVNNQVVERRLCLPCAQAAQTGAASAASPIFDLLSALGKRVSRPRRPPACGRCGLTYAEFRKTGRLGCADCYESFAVPLKDLLKRIHGTSAHSGKAPAAFLKARGARELASMRKELENAIRAERYEAAARLRDKIRKLEG